MSFFQIHSKTHRVVRANRVFISADGWADGLRPKGGKSKKGPGMLGWCWMDLDWYLWISGNPATNTNEHVFGETTFFFFRRFFSANQVWNSKWIWWYIFSTPKLQNAPHKLFSKQKASITVNRFCQKVWCLRMASFFSQPSLVGLVSLVAWRVRSLVT